MHEGQARRYFPLPDYDLLSDSTAVRMTIYGGVVDPAYSQLLMQKTDLPLTDVLALDRVQKKLPIPENAARHLRQSKLIEGRKPNFHVSAVVAAATDKKAEYIRMRAVDTPFMEERVVHWLTKVGSASRKDIDDMLLPNMGEVFSDEQKKNKVGNLLSQMRMKGIIHNVGSRTAPIWTLMSTEGEHSKKESKKAKKGV